MVISAWHQCSRLVRTVRHFPVSSVFHRLRLRTGRNLYRPAPAPVGLHEEWRTFSAARAIPWQLAPDFRRWQLQHWLGARQRVSEKAARLLKEQTGELLNEAFHLYRKPGDLVQNLPVKSPLWRENYGYLEFLLPLVFELEKLDQREQNHCAVIVSLLDNQFRLFWQLSFKARTWSTYGISRRLLTYCELLPLLDRFSDEFQALFWQNFYQDTSYVALFPELDLGGNHLVKNMKALLAATLALEQLPSASLLAGIWWKDLADRLPALFEKQVLEDGFHYERTPMYHAWVLVDLLDCLHWLHAAKPDYATERLRNTAKRMMAVLTGLRHSSGQLPMFGDSSLPQTPDVDVLLDYGRYVLSLEADESGAANIAPSSETRLLTHFADAGIAVFRQDNPEATLVLDCGNFGPHDLPAHSHADMGSLEVHVGLEPVIVDSGISEYEPSLLRDYFRSTAAHNTVWVPGDEQAELWGSFRIAEYPDFQGCKAEQDASGAKVTLEYDNYRHRYHHQRSVYSVAGRFWVVQDWLTDLKPADRPCHSLLHIHPDHAIRFENETFIIANRLLLVPFGYRSLDWTNDSPWRNNLNLYSPGFSLARPGKLAAIVPRLEDCFGWVMIPFHASTKPTVTRQGEGAEIHFSLPAESYRLTWDSTGLHVAVHAPTPGYPSR